MHDIYSYRVPMKRNVLRHRKKTKNYIFVEISLITSYLANYEAWIFVCKVHNLVLLCKCPMINLLKYKVEEILSPITFIRNINFD